MTLYLGIDGGGTGCRALLGAADGRVLGRGSAGSANVATDAAAAASSILAATQGALRDAGLPEDTAGAGDLVCVLSVAGANVPEAAARVRALLPFAAPRIVSDAVGSTRGALGADDGIVAAIGTGSVFTRQRNGEVHQIGGWGAVLGDEASGAWLGRRVLAACLRAQDGRMPMTGYLRAVLDRFGGAPRIVEFARDATPAEFATLAPDLMQADDPAAAAIIAQACDEVAAFVDTLQDGAPLPVVFLGGLGPQFERRLAGRWPIRVARGSGVDGALALALEGVGSRDG